MTVGSSGSRGAPAGAPDGPRRGQVLVGRYHLDDLVGADGAGALWRGTDERLRRPIAVRVLDVHDVRADGLEASAARVAGIADRRVVPVLDVLRTATHVVVVTPWVRSTGLGHLLAGRGGEPLDPAEATRIARDLADCLAGAHASGVTHGRIRPDSVALTDLGEVQVRGLGVDAVLWGVSPPGDPVAADVHGVGAVLYAGLTGRWPDGDADGLDGAPTLGQGRVPAPRQVVADVPGDADRVCVRALGTTALPRDTSRYTSCADLATDLAAVAGHAATPAVPVLRARHSSGRAPRVVGSVVAAVGVLLVALLGVQLVSGLGSPPVTRGGATGPTVAPPVGGSPTSSAPAGSGTQVIPIVSVKDVDPQGNGSEHPQLDRFAHDADPATAWTTMTYKRADIPGKTGVGLLLDLGAPRSFDAVSLRLVGDGTDLQVRASDSTPNPLTMPVVASAKSAPSTTLLRTARPVSARYVVIWLTRLPISSSGFQGGVAEVQVLS